MTVLCVPEFGLDCLMWVEGADRVEALMDEHLAGDGPHVPVRVLLRYLPAEEGLGNSSHKCTAVSRRARI